VQTLIERLASSDHELVVLAPSGSVPKFFRNVPSGSAYDDLLEELQRLRGQVYLEDGAIVEEQLDNGRHRTPEDDRAWHLLIISEHRVVACV
jgi:hypothetical protein